MSSTDPTPIGDRMKRYEAAARIVLPRRTFTIIRVDIRAAHSYLRHADRPFDETFVADMNAVAAALCGEVAGTAFGYVQSDEISLLVTDFASPQTEPWFGGVVQKVASVAAAEATAELNARRPDGRAVFDARVFTIPDRTEVLNYFLWRQRDCVRNSIMMAAQARFSHARLQGLNGGELQDLLWSEAGVNWNDCDVGCKRGRVVAREAFEGDVTYTDGRSGEEVTTRPVRTRWVAQGAPHFTADPGGELDRLVPNWPGKAAA